MNKITNEYSVKWDDIEIRDFQEKDIPAWTHYWYDCPDSKHVQSMINWDIFPKQEEFEKDQLEKLEKEPSRFQVVLFKGKPIGVHTLTFEANDEVCIHAHFWDAEARGKRIAVVSGFKAMKIFFEKYNLQEIYLKPPIENKMSATFMEKSGILPIREEIYQIPIIKTGTKVKVYRIKKEELTGIEQMIRTFF